MLPVRNLLLRQEEPAASPAASAGSSSPTPSPVVSETPPAAQPSSNATEAAEPPAVSVSSTNATVATTHRKRRIAVVGAGASGSGAAFFLARAARVVEAQLGLAPGSLLEIVVYEKNDYIGGRECAVTVTEPFMGEKLELGAAMMVNANINLRKVAAKFHLPLIAAPGGTAARMDMWDGKKVVYSNTGVAWWDKLTSGIRYGFLSPLRQASAVTKFVERMAQVYSPSFLAQRGTVNSIEQFVASLQLGSEYTSRSAFEWATKVVGVSARWANEMMDSMTRSNFGADVTQVHGIAALAGASVSEGALFMYGGNNQMFQAMLADSGADVRLSTAVTDITAAPGGGYIVSSANAPSNTTYDEVFWGNPWHLSPVAKGLQFTTPIPPQEYVRLHVTYVGTTATTPPPKYFKQGSKVVMAQSISTTGERARGGGDAPAFQVLLYHLAYPMSSIVLLFSHETLSDTEIRDIFGDTITWTHRKEWDGAYPLMKPTTVYPPVQPRAGFHYLAAMEPWLSTMETQTISAREAVARAVDAWWGLGVAQCDAGSSWDLACEPAPPPAMTLEELFNSMAGQ
ncbi:hypothetical protein CC85DRAFT_271477 [Cutaneotrichosporon oleaginosum]|uniref:Prenylcysteine lyase domain-containing protein n=1 Tax=Cutaneotrichosporon oleaginosum TaxID=879819 RepID=A0A0J0XT79_9TREE|nr:uncharacterized protein CC85DRAFT_271477 [Cutaneotrichosporon oleaginosum]KLT44280.1 hypothetical protein CC85DRAFT_271477 [Cutaneotrichosporon oleaginosum]TXT11552.1 hypothetical protein COLE_01962 [Cutaneotrichosporon oleaginosum]